MRITTLSPDNLKLLRNHINLALKQVGEEFGVKLDAGNASYSAANAHFKLNVSTLGNAGEVMTPGRVALKRCFPHLVDKEITLSSGASGKVIEYNQRSHKYPFIIRTVRGGMFKVGRRAVGEE